jgi:hypothetical protein
MDGIVDIAELPAPTRRRTLSFYVVLLFLVLPFWLAIPLAWVFVTYSLHTGKIWTYGVKDLVLFVFALAEVRGPVFNFTHCSSHYNRPSSAFITFSLPDGFPLRLR